MTDRIDHAAEAWELLVASVSDQTVQSRAGFDAATLMTARAQVHATLALVEQQRIANLIALSESGRTTVNGARAALSTLYDGRSEDGTSHMELRSDIAAALGIEEDE